MNAPDSSTDLKGQALSEQRFQIFQSIAEELSGEVTFPTSFDVVVRLRKALQDENQTLDQIAMVLSTEPLIPVRLIQLANSAAFNRGREVKEIKEAINRLGLNTVRAQSMAIAMSQLLRSKEMVIFGDLPDRIWTHSLRTACSAFVLCRRMTRIQPDEGLLAGMVHDLGAFFLLYRFRQYKDLVMRQNSVKHLLARWHESISHSLLVSLGMPDEIAEAVRDHDSPRPIPEKPANLADVIYISNLLAGGMADWLALDEFTEDSKADVEQARALYQEHLEEIEAFEQEMRHALE
jgi:HD-like signal output (HDOD) protein